MVDDLRPDGGVTLAAGCGLTEELGRYIAEIAASELAGGRIEGAREIAEGLAVSNPHDAAPWVILALVHRRRGDLAAARVCAEAARRNAPGDEQVRLVRAEILLGSGGDGRAAGVEELSALAAGKGDVGNRARALLGVIAA
jgi:cytochrome c-type biogenesis protein CcmH/NrfG